MEKHSGEIGENYTNSESNEFYDDEIFEQCEQMDNNKPIQQNNTQDNKYDRETVRTRSGRQLKRR